MDINVTVNNICLLNPDTLNSGEAYIHKLNFNFSKEYTSDLVYRACFTCLSGTYVSPILNNECEIPPEVLENEGIIELGVYAYILEDNTLIKRFSPEHIFIKIIAGSYREGLESEAPTPTEQEQWIDSFNRNYLNKIELFNENAATKTQEFTDVADKAASDINNVVEKLEEDVASHVYDGATFIPNVDTEGNISWTNNQDFPNPETRNIRGPQGPQGETGPVGPAGAVKIRMVDELPDVSEAEEGVLYFVPKEETETAEDLYEEYVFTDGRYEFIGSRHISIDLTDYVKFTDYGTGQKAGVIKTGNSLSINGTGQPVAIERTYEQYTSMSNTNFIGKGTLENFVAGRNLETANNKVTEINENSTDTEYPSAKAVYNSIKDFSTEEELLSENSTENVEGTELEIDNTIDSRIKLNKLGGNTSQDTTEGYNILPNRLTQGTSKGITYQKKSDGSVVLNGTSTGTIDLYIFGDWNSDANTIVLSPQKYVLGIKYTEDEVNKNVKLFIVKDKTTAMGNTSSRKIFNIEQETIVTSLLLRVENETTLNNYVVYPILYKGEDLTTPYEPYTNGASPNPDYPQEVKVVTGENVVSVQGKNFLDLNNPMYTKTPLQPDGAAFGTSTVSNISQYIKVKENTKYTLSLTNDSYSRRIAFYSNPLEEEVTSEKVISVIDYGGNTKTFTTPNNCKYIRFSYFDVADNVQLEEGSATEYQPYSKTDYPINLGTLELCKINDYADYIYRDNGKWYLEKKIGKVVLDGSETGWHTSGLNVTGYKSYYVDSSVQIYSHVSGNKCNYFEFKTFGEWIGLLEATFIEVTPQAIGIRVLETLAPTLEDFKTWLSTHNTIVYYALETPTEEEITDTTLLYQLESFYNAKTIQEKTIISQENEELPFILDLDYFTNSIAGNIAGTNYNVDVLIADIEKALEEINGESVGG